MKKGFILFTISLLFLVLSGCSKNDDSTPTTPTPTPDPVENPPSFNVSAQPVTLVTGDAGLSFYAFCTTEDINLVKVEVHNPRGQSTTYNANNNLFLKNQEFECQTPGTGYFKYLGTWTLVFVGNRATGTKSSFSVSTSISVTGKKLP